MYHKKFDYCNEFSDDIRVNVDLISELTMPQITSRLIVRTYSADLQSEIS